MQKIKYIGTQDNLFEVAVTGKQSTWKIGQMEERDNTEAALLLATGLFEAPSVPVTSTTNLLTGVIESLPGVFDKKQLAGMLSRTFRNHPLPAKEVSYSGGSYAQQGTGTATEYAGAEKVGTETNWLVTTAATTNSVTGMRYRWASGGPSVDGNGGFVVPVKVISVGSATSGEVRLTISNTVPSGTANVTGLQYLQLNVVGWQYLYFPLDKFTVNGAPTQIPNGVLYDFQISVTTKTNDAIQCIVGTVYWGAGMRPCISLGCDDGLLSQYHELFPLMQRNGLRGTMAVAADYVGAAGYMTERMFDEMYAAGWDFVVHGHTDHGGFASYAALKADIERNRDFIAARWPRAAEHYTYVGGVVNNNWSVQALKELGFKTARMVTGGHKPALPMYNRDAWLIMPSNSIMTSSVSTRLSEIDSAVTGLYPISEIHWHSVNPVSPEPSVEATGRADTLSIIEKVRDYIAAGKLDALTRTELYARYGAKADSGVIS